MKGLVCRVLSLVSYRKLERSFCNNVSSSSNPLVSRLLQTPNSQVKTTLDSVDVFSLNNSQFFWDALITSLRCSSPDKARLVLEWKLDKMLKGNGARLDQYCSLISLCGKIQNVPLAMHVFTLMEARGIKPDSSTFNSLICACLCSGDVVTALSLFEIMVSSEDYEPNVETYDTFIAGFSSLGNADAMQKWYAAKMAAGFSANVQTYESLICGSVKARDYDGADRYYEEMMLSGIIPSIPILENVLEGLCKCKKFGQVKEFLKFLLDGGWKINEKMAGKLVRFYCDHRKVDEKEELLETLTKSNQSREVLLQVHCGIIRLHALSDRLDEVEYSVGRMGKQGLSFKHADDVDKVICSYFRCKAYDRLDLFLEHIKGSYTLPRSTYDFLIAGYRRAGLSEKMDSVMNDMKLAGIL
ncbi:Pentatricopeptide repeat [Melia azedarach]|uniref:Pentatricopeptide repeat n=1 Tax=Melia azedarach TaxID=155640 RepID=A0ACC1X9V4_MELAZ|nr:Pentatricopeptide repeat [Melia azedarach]